MLAKLNHVRTCGPSQGGLIGVPFMNSPNLEARVIELAKAPGRTNSVGKYSVGA